MSQTTTDQLRIGQTVTVLPATVDGATRTATVIAIGNVHVLLAGDDDSQTWVPAFRITESGALERQALRNVLGAIEDASAELAEASQDAIDKYLAATDRPPTWSEIEKFDQLRTALERAISAANTILA